MRLTLGLQWLNNWLRELISTETTTDYEAQGILGQYTYVCREKNMVIVRLGKKEVNINWEQLFLMIADKN